MTKRAIANFIQDDESHWVAVLTCGHTQHMRHRPPLESRPWVTTSEGRTNMLGTSISCSFCDMPQLPQGLLAYKRTPSFDETSIPPGLLKEHRTKAHV